MITLLLAIQLASYDLSAQQADYDGKTLILNGQIEIAHPMGRLSAQKATIENLNLRSSHKKTTHLHLENDVEIDVPEGKIPFSVRAKRAECDLFSSNPFSYFQVQEVRFLDQVQISTQNDLAAAGGFAVYKSGTFTLFPSAPKTHCQLIRGREEIYAQKIDFDLASETLHLEGTVQLHSSRMKNKESFATADHLFYHLGEKLIVLAAIPPKKVLFWQNDLSLSANEIKIRQDPQTGTESIEGFGDVHFTFDDEEQNFIEKFFSNYL